MKTYTRDDTVHDVEYVLKAEAVALLRAAIAAERERWTSAIGAVMPADFKDWHENSTAELPEIAAWVIRNLRERERFLEGLIGDIEE